MLIGLVKLNCVIHQLAIIAIKGDECNILRAPISHVHYRLLSFFLRHLLLQIFIAILRIQTLYFSPISLL